MANKLKGFRLPEITLTQLDWLIANGYGSQSQVVVTAISKLYAAAQRPRPEAQEQAQAQERGREEEER